MKRNSISVRLRFEIFKRDGFACQYCGGHPPNVLLHLDHIIAVSEGGSDSSDNLVTSCQSCNLGKSNIPLSQIPQSLKDKADRIAESEAQLRGYYAVIEAKRNRIENEVWKVCDVLDEKYSKDGIKRDWYASIERFIDRLGFYVVLAAMDTARTKCPYSDKSAFLYFCSICWRKIKEMDDA